MNIHFFLCVSQLSNLLSHNYKGEEESSKLRALTRTGIDLPLLYKYLTSLCQRYCQSVMRISLVHFARALLLEQNRSYRKVEHIQSNVFSRCLVTHGRPCTDTMALFPFLSFFLPPGSINPHTRWDYMPSFQCQIVP